MGQRAAEWKGLGNRTLVYIRQRQVDAVVVTLAEAIGTGVDPGRGGMNVAFSAARELRPWRQGPIFAECTSRPTRPCS